MVPRRLQVVRAFRRQRGDSQSRYWGDRTHVMGQGVDHAVRQSPFAHVDGRSVHWVSDAVAFLGDQGGLYTHDQARHVLDAIERFYDRITSDHLAILRMDDTALTHDDLVLVRTYCQSDRR